MKKALIFALTLALCLGLSAPAAAVGGFNDVSETDYYADAVQWAVENEIAVGTTNTTFSPNETCTTAQILTFLWRSQGKPEPTIQNPFTDISSGDYYYKAALWAYQNGLVSGSAFGPSTPCTGSMVVTYLWKLAGSPEVSVPDADYAPFTISGKAAYYNPEIGTFDYQPLTITFSGVSLKKEILPYVDEIPGYPPDVWVSMGMLSNFDPWSVTIITLQPGSTSSFSNGADWIMTPRHGSASFDYSEISALYKGATTSELYWSATDAGQFCAGPAENFTGFGHSGWTHLGEFQDADGDPYIVRYGDGFSDVPSSAPYAQAVTWAAREEITDGTGEGAFSPDMVCSRGRIMTFLYRAFAK